MSQTIGDSGITHARQ